MQEEDFGFLDDAFIDNFLLECWLCWMEDSLPLDPFQRFCSSWLSVEEEALISWEPLQTPGHSVVFGDIDSHSFPLTLLVSQVYTSLRIEQNIYYVDIFRLSLI